MAALVAGLLLGRIAAANPILSFNSLPLVENRTMDQMYQVVLKGNRVITMWHGGDEQNQADAIRTAFETKFPDLKLNVTVDLSKYLDGRIDQQIVAKNVYVDSIVLQTLHDYPRWAREGALLNYAPLGFDKIYTGFKDSLSAAYYGLELFSWMNLWNPQKLSGANFSTYDEYLKPEYKDKLVLTYPHDDDAVLFAYQLIMERKGQAWFDALLAQNPRWVRGTATPLALLLQNDTNEAAAFAISGSSFAPTDGSAFAFPTDADFVSWPQMGGILKSSPNPEGAKLLHSWMLTPEFQQNIGWSVRSDVDPPDGYPKIVDMPNTDPMAFAKFMEDRATVERLRFWFEDRLGTAQGQSPLTDDM
ncbi:hypothetical protein CDD80_2680 [Ophiocordyceps camponoti-rufipedis]|uniref:ABC-type Fe3+ transport system n=1 Tax=Ophiocordyceps camponoti-rufipedis TaxID=2004952 RepID=A0A2C5ZK67_9HYPO|nr:hypothetical protein CDD80_2680 [Ophiocordyceps camponoti-rufipedis]